MFWWVVPAAYTLVRSETKSEAVALSAAALVPLTPLFWPLVWNDFRELQLAGPFVLWAVQGVRSRSAGWAAVGIAGMLACRQEFAVMVATFAFLPPRDPETLSSTLRWRRTIFLIGLLWLMFGFFVYLRFMLGSGSANSFIDQFLGPRASFRRNLGNLARNTSGGNGGLGSTGVPGSSGRDSRLALDLGHVQRAMGDAHALDLGMARRALRHADGGHGAGGRSDRLRATGELVTAASRRPSLDGDGLDLRGACSAEWVCETSPIGWRRSPC